MTILMVAAVIGSRSFVDYNYLHTILSKYNITDIVSGGACGADSLAITYAKEKSLKYHCYISDYGIKAPFVRNKLIVSASQICIAFWDGVSKGTEYTLGLAFRHGLAVDVYVE